MTPHGPATAITAPLTDNAGRPDCGGSHDAAHLDRLRSLLMGPIRVAALADTFKALGDPTRVRILDALARAELCVCDLAALIGLSESAVSHQLRVLRALRLVRPRRAGRQVFYALDDRHIVGLFRQALSHVQEERPASRPGPGERA